MSTIEGLLVALSVLCVGVRKVNSDHFELRGVHNRINRMSVDFLVCLKDSSIGAAIELDDRSHNSWSRRKADVKKQKALESAGITLIRWQGSSLPDEITIRAAFTKLSNLIGFFRGSI